MYLYGNGSMDVCLAKLRVLHKCIYMEICGRVPRENVYISTFVCGYIHVICV